MKLIIKVVCTLVLFCGVSFTLYASKVTSTKSGKWSENIWDKVGGPTVNDSVFIGNGTIVTIDNDYSVQYI